MNREDREELREMLSLVVKPIDDLLQVHDRTLFGNGSEGNQGLRVDVDRLKQGKKNEEKHFWLLYAGIVGVIVKSAWAWVTSRVGSHP